MVNGRSFAESTAAQRRNVGRQILSAERFRDQASQRVSTRRSALRTRRKRLADRLRKLERRERRDDGGRSPRIEALRARLAATTAEKDERLQQAIKSRDAQQARVDKLRRQLGEDFSRFRQEGPRRLTPGFRSAQRARTRAQTARAPRTVAQARAERRVAVERELARTGEATFQTREGEFFQTGPVASVAPRGFRESQAARATFAPPEQLRRAERFQAVSREPTPPFSSAVGASTLAGPVQFFSVPRPAEPVPTPQLERRVIRRPTVIERPIRQAGAFLALSAEDFAANVPRGARFERAQLAVAREARGFGVFLTRRPREFAGTVLGGQLLAGPAVGARAATGFRTIAGRFGVPAARITERGLAVGGVGLGAVQIAREPEGRRVATAIEFGAFGAGFARGFRQVVPAPTAVPTGRAFELQSFVARPRVARGGEQIQTFTGRGTLRESFRVQEFGVARPETRVSQVRFAGVQEAPGAGTFRLRAEARVGTRVTRAEGFFVPDSGVTALRAGRRGFFGVREPPVAEVRDLGFTRTVEPFRTVRTRGGRRVTVEEEGVGLAQTEAFEFAEPAFVPRTRELAPGVRVTRERPDVLFTRRDPSLGAFGTSVSVPRAGRGVFRTEPVTRLPSETALLFGPPRGARVRARLTAARRGLRGRRGELRRAPQAVFEPRPQAPALRGRLRQRPLVEVITPRGRVAPRSFAGVGFTARTGQARTPRFDTGQLFGRVSRLDRLQPTSRVTISDTSQLTRVTPATRIISGFGQRTTPRTTTRLSLLGALPAPGPVSGPAQPPLIGGLPGFTFPGIPTGGPAGRARGAGRRFSFAPDVRALLGGERGRTRAITPILTGFERRFLR